MKENFSLCCKSLKIKKKKMQKNFVENGQICQIGPMSA
jgi:hypothetical protein